MFSDEGTTGIWTIFDDYKTIIESDDFFNFPGRVMLASAPSDENIVLPELEDDRAWQVKYIVCLYISTQSGRLFRVENSQFSPDVTDITGTGFPTGNISCIAMGGSEDTLLVTFSNYGVPSVWQTVNNGRSWENKEGDQLVPICREPIVPALIINI